MDFYAIRICLYGYKRKIVSMAIYGENRDRSKSQDIGNKKEDSYESPSKNFSINALNTWLMFPFNRL